MVLTEKYRAVTIISLNRPDKKNAMNKEMIRALAKAMRAFDEDEQSSVGILCGVGGNFSVGPDLEEISAAMERKENILDNLTVSSQFQVYRYPLLSTKVKKAFRSLSKV